MILINWPNGKINIPCQFSKLDIDNFGNLIVSSFLQTPFNIQFIVFGCLDMLNPMSVLGGHVWSGVYPLHSPLTPVSMYIPGAGFPPEENFWAIFRNSVQISLRRTTFVQNCAKSCVQISTFIDHHSFY